MDIQLLYIDSNRGTLKKHEEYLAEYFDVISFTNPFDCLQILEKEMVQVILMNDNFQTAANLNFFRKLSQLFPLTLKILIVSLQNFQISQTGGIHRISKLDFKKHGCCLLKKYVDEFYCKFITNLKLSNNHQSPLIIGSHPALMDQIKTARRIAKFSENVLISGETGTGKDLFAKFIHSKSERKSGPFHIVNCASIHSSLFEAEFFGHKKGAFTGAIETSQGHFCLADEGTLVLDEVSEIDLISQAKLLRAIENQEFFPVGSQKLSKVNTRIIAISNKNLEDQILKGTFRKDLYHRINTFNVKLPALRERITDIECLVQYFIKKFLCKYPKNQTLNLEENIFPYLREMEFPGNVRELESLIFKIMSQVRSRSAEIKLADIQPVLTMSQKEYRNIPQHFILKDFLNNIQYETIRDVFRNNKSNISKTALSLGMSRQNLQYLLKKYGLKSQL
ncbi:MAG: hypothetical protein A2Y94_13675 [Caldithrix sp. RBG_13_44_9]|nr:MAG: hypothetical protein A2Y94_13675 [Caldithrix sp. RBG_13_44_9]